MVQPVRRPGGRDVRHRDRLRGVVPDHRRGHQRQRASFNERRSTDFGVTRDTYWPRSLAAMLITALVLIVLSVQLVSPTRRWRLRRPRRRRRPPGATRDARTQRSVRARPPRGAARGAPRSSRPIPRPWAWSSIPALAEIRAGLAHTGGGSGCAAPSGGPGTSRPASRSPSSCSRSPSGCCRSSRRRSSRSRCPSSGCWCCWCWSSAPGPSLGETALAVDAEGGGRRRRRLGARVRERAAAAAGPADRRRDETIAVDGAFDLAEAEARFVRRQRRDALARLRAIDPRLFRPRLGSRPALVALVAVALIVPALLLPNPMDQVIAQNRQVREEANRQAERIDADRQAARGQGRQRQRPAHPAGGGARGPRRAAARRRPASSTGTSPSWGPSRTTSARSSIRRTSRRPPRSRRCRGRCRGRPPGNPQANPGGDPKATKEDLAQARRQGRRR